MSADLVGSLKSGFTLLKRKDDDGFDRISNRYTIAILLACSLFLATKSYVGDPIDCYAPQEFADNWVSYTDNYCWIKNTYYIPIDKDIPREDHLKPELPYYQWVPFILVFMIFIFAIPAGFWSFAMQSSGYDIEAIVKASSGSDSLNPETRDDTHKYLVAQLDRHIMYHRPRNSRGVKLGNNYGRYLFIMYIITKCLYIAAPVLLFEALHFMMGEGYGDYGVRAINGLVKDDGTYIENPMFPRVTFCDFSVRRLGTNLHTYTVQCVLTVNLFNEKVFLIIWWWLVFVIIATAIGLIVCLIRNLAPNSGTNFLMKFLVLKGCVNPNDPNDRNAVSLFANNYLRLDGVFCMRLLAQNVNDVVGAEIISSLYNKWRELHYDKMNGDGIPLVGSRRGSNEHYA